MLNTHIMFEFIRHSINERSINTISGLIPFYLFKNFKNFPPSKENNFL